MPTVEEIYKETLPFWNQLDRPTQSEMMNASRTKTYRKGEIIHAGKDDCTGLFMIHSGRVRTYIITEEGKEVTLFRLVEGDVCIFSASCVMKNISFDTWISAETDLETAILPSEVYQELMKRNTVMANFTNEVLNARMSDVMWILEKVLFMSFDKRLAEFLYEQASLEGSDDLGITHDQIARHMGSAREVVTRMLKYLAGEGLLEVKRGCIHILDRKKLYEYGNK